MRRRFNRYRRRSYFGDAVTRDVRVRVIVLENVFPFGIHRCPVMMVPLQQLFFEPRIYARLWAWICLHNAEGD